MKTQVASDRQYGEEILSTQQLGRKISGLKIAVYALGAVIIVSTALEMVAADPKPLLLDTSTGNIITDYKGILDGYTIEERALLAKLSYEGLRRRTGNTAADAQSLNDWKNNITANGYNAWKNLSPRWSEPHFIQPGFTRTLRVTDVRPDLKNPYAFSIEAIESEAQIGKPISHKQYRIRLTLFFTDPKTDGMMKIDGVILHEEELMK